MTSRPQPLGVGPRGALGRTVSNLTSGALAPAGAPALPATPARADAHDERHLEVTSLP